MVCGVVWCGSRSDVKGVGGMGSSRQVYAIPVCNPVVWCVVLSCGAYETWCAVWCGAVDPDLRGRAWVGAWVG